MVYDLLGLNVRSLFLLLLFTSLSAAQTSPVTCLSAWSWTLNSRQQSPCLVAAYLLAPCANGQWNVPALEDGQFYSSPDLAQTSNCICSTVTYSLMSACGYCQGQSIVTWSSWKTNCTESLTSIRSYPRAVSPSTPVPAWAYLDVVSGDKFDESQARGLQGVPEATVSGSYTGELPTSTASTAATNSPSKSNNLPAIIGGTVGGVVGLGLIICLVIFLMKRKGSQTRVPPSAEFAKVMSPGSPIPSTFDPAAVGFRSMTASPGFTHDGNSGKFNPHLMHQNVPGHITNGGGAPPGPIVSSPWSPPPGGHTPAPSGGPYTYTPPPPEMDHNIYTPPPGSIGSGSVPYSHSRGNSGNVGFATSPPNSATNPLIGHNRNPSYPTHPGIPEM